MAYTTWPLDMGTTLGHRTLSCSLSSQDCVQRSAVHQSHRVYLREHDGKRTVNWVLLLYLLILRLAGYKCCPPLGGTGDDVSVLLVCVAVGVTICDDDDVRRRQS